MMIVDGTMVQHVHLTRSTICNCMYTSYSEKMKDTGWVQGICCTCSLHDKQRNQNIRRHLHAVLGCCDVCSSIRAFGKLGKPSSI